MRIYTAPGVNAYTANASSIDQQLTLSPGTHGTVIQAWDNCGRVYRATGDDYGAVEEGRR